jgi:NAD(P)H-hydrate epimerase
MLAMPQPLLAQAMTLVPTATGIELPVDEVGRLMSSAAIEAIDRQASGCRCLVVGPGFGSDWPQQQIVATLLARDDRPIVLDADGLNAFSALESGHLELQAPTIMTPHVGEYKRLAQSFDLDPSTNDLGAAAESLARTLGCIVVLKSSSTVITDGVHTVEETGGSVVLATGGTGDVLSGIIAGVVSSFGVDCATHLLEAAVLGVRIHAVAGERFARTSGTTGMLATDLLREVPPAISQLREV